MALPMFGAANDCRLWERIVRVWRDGSELAAKIFVVFNVNYVDV